MEDSFERMLFQIKKKAASVIY